MTNDNNEPPRSYEFGEFRLLPEQRKLVGPDGEPVELRGKVFDLLLHLVQNRGQLVEKDALMEALWPGVVVHENNLNQAITALRQALGEKAQEPKYIATITGRGYQFVGEVREVEHAGAPTRVTAGRGLRLTVAAILVGAVAALIWAINRDEPAPSPSSVVLDQFEELAPRLVTSFHGSHSQPTLSPDGSMMAWISDIDGTAHIWVGNLQFGDPIQVTRGDLAANSPSWSPDNSQIVFDRARPNVTSIFAVDTLGTSPPRLLIEAAANPSYAQRADQFVFTRGRQIWVADGDGQNARKIENLPIEQNMTDRAPALSPDGGLIAFTHAAAGPFGNLWVIGTDADAQARQLTFYDVEELRSVFSPTFSPDGREIVFSLGEKNGTASLWRISVDGGEPAALTTGSGTLNFPAISANGQRIVYTDRRLTSKLFVVSPESGDRRTIYESRNEVVLPMASPDGTQIVFFSRLSNGAHIMTIGSDGRSLRQRTFDDGGFNALPVFGSDGDSVYYYENRNLVRQDLDEGRIETVLEDFHWSTRNWIAIHDNRIAYQEVDREASTQRTVVLDMSDDTLRELPAKIEGMTWSRDGSELLGFVRNPGDILICGAESLDCEPVSNLGEPVRGYLPRWSRDEQQIFYLRQSEARECCDLWVVNRDGSDARSLTHLDSFDYQSGYFGVTDQGEIFYNMIDGGDDEIWLVSAE